MLVAGCPAGIHSTYSSKDSERIWATPTDSSCPDSPMGNAKGLSQRRRAHDNDSSGSCGWSETWTAMVRGCEMQRKTPSCFIRRCSAHDCTLRSLDMDSRVSTVLPQALGLVSINQHLPDWLACIGIPAIWQLNFHPRVIVTGINIVIIFVTMILGCRLSLCHLGLHP